MAGSARNSAKKRGKKERTKKKRIGAEGEIIHPNPGNLCAYGGRRKNKRKKQGAGPQPSYLDHLVVSYDPYGSYGGPTLKHPIRKTKCEWDVNCMYDVVVKKRTYYENGSLVFRVNEALRKNS